MLNERTISQLHVRRAMFRREPIAIGLRDHLSLYPLFQHPLQLTRAKNLNIHIFEKIEISIFYINLNFFLHPLSLSLSPSLSFCFSPSGIYLKLKAWTKREWSFWQAKTVKFLEIERQPRFPNPRTVSEETRRRRRRREEKGVAERGELWPDRLS